MFKYIPKILWAIVATLSLVLAGVFGTSPASAKDGLIVSDCDEFGRIGWTVYWSNDTAKELAFVLTPVYPASHKRLTLCQQTLKARLTLVGGSTAPRMVRLTL